MAERFDIARVEHLLATLQPARLTRVVDVGANPISPAPYQALKEIGGCEVWGFEPHPGQFAKLLETAGENEHYLPHALGDGGRHGFNITRSSGFSSLLAPNPAVARGMGRFGWGMTVAETREVETRALDDIAELPAFDLLKIDVQGAEAMVFEHGARALDGALAVITEVSAIPLYEGQPLLDDQMRLLRARGFDLHKFLHFRELKVKSPRTARLRAGTAHANQLIDGDAVFLRALFDHDALDDEQIKHMVLLADAVFESFDLAAVLLGRLVDRGRVTEAAFDAYVDRLPGLKRTGAVKGAAA